MKIYTHKYYKYNPKTGKSMLRMCDFIKRDDDDDQDVTIVKLANGKLQNVISKRLIKNYDTILP